MKDGKKHIMIADDEKEIRDILSLLLSGDGYTVTAVEDGQCAAEQASPDVDLYILDVNMPRLSGIMTAAEIRKKYDTPIIFLTAYSSESDKVMGFSAGADDYVVKPFSNIELLMRVKAILRRNTAAPPPQAENRLAFQDVILDLDRQALMKDGSTIPLTYTEFKIVELLASHKKRFTLWTTSMRASGRQRCGGQRHHGTHQEHPQKVRRQFPESSLHQNRVGKGLLY